VLCANILPSSAAIILEIVTTSVSRGSNYQTLPRGSKTSRIHLSPSYREGRRSELPENVIR